MFGSPGSPSKHSILKPGGKQRIRTVFLQGVLIGLLFVFSVTTLTLLLKRRRIYSSIKRIEPTVDPESLSPHHKKNLHAFVGVQTGFTQKYTDERYVYETRRAMLRQSWFPSPKSALDAFEEKTGIRVRFIIGHSTNAEKEYRLQQEQEEHDDFVRVDFEEHYLSLTFKTLIYLKYVVEHFNAKYIVKVDDDVYFRLDRLPVAIPQWLRKRADYVGCMKRGEVFTSESTRWHEPQHALLGRAYYTHCWGSIYVVSGRAAGLIASIPEGNLRFFNNEDTTVGSWMLAFNVTHFDDRRLCTRKCEVYTLAVFNNVCAGLCAPHRELVELHKTKSCRENPGKVPLLKEILPVSRFGSRQIPQRHHSQHVVL